MADRVKNEVKDTEPKSISMLGLVGKFRDVHARMENRNFCFILGAGASVTSGIKSAGKMVEEWIETIYREATNHTGAVPADWATEKTLGINQFDPKDPAGAYSALYRRMYENDPDAGYAYLEERMKHAEPSFGYSVLGRILADTRHRVVITVNFDNLVADSVSLFSDTYPLVCGHELLAPFVTDKLRRPLILKVHRDLLLGPMSTDEEIQKIDKGFSDAISRLLKNYTPIVIGYGGNDGSLMRCLDELPENTIPGGIYWCYRDGSDQPSKRIEKVVAKHKGHLVSIMGFDELLMQFGNELKFGVPDRYVLDRAKSRADRIVKQAQELQQKIKKRDEDASGLVAKIVKPKKPTAAKNETGAVSDAMSNTMRRKDGDKRWWQWATEADAEGDPAKRDDIYQEAIKALPKSSELLSSYANFLSDVRKDHNAAEVMHKQAIDIDRKSTDALVNYANFLSYCRNDQNMAEAMYKQAIDADPNNAFALSNYANLLTNHRKDHDTAEAMYKRTIHDDPKDADWVGNYSRFLLSTGRIEEGLDRLDEAFANLWPGYPDQVDVECWMYAYCCRPAEKQAEALAALKSLILTTDLRTDDWDFSRVIEQAKKMNHPEADWLAKLAEVLSGRAGPDTLNGWEAWNSAGPEKKEPKKAM